MRFALLTCLLALLCTVGCGGKHNNSGSSPATSVSITPTTTNIKSGDQVGLTARLNGKGSVNWSVVGGAANGTVQSVGTNLALYTAPVTPGTYQVTATLKGSTTVFKTLSLQVAQGIVVSITPSTTVPVMCPTSKLQFSASVVGTTNSAVLWTASTGTISSTGLYTAPAAPGSYNVTATSAVDNTRKRVVAVTVKANPTVAIAVSGRGTVTLTLNTDKAPATCANFVTLVDQQFYDGTKFHRLQAGAFVQGGDPLTKTLPVTDPSIGTGGPGYTIPYETTGLSNIKFSIAMAHTNLGLDTAGSQFFINWADNSAAYDGTYAVFGMVTSGTSVALALKVGDKVTSMTVK